MVRDRIFDSLQVRVYNSSALHYIRCTAPSFQDTGGKQPLHDKLDENAGSTEGLTKSTPLLVLLLPSPAGAVERGCCTLGS